MNDRQENKLSMYLAVLEYLAKFLTLLAKLPNFQPLFTKLQNAVVKIQDCGEQQEIDKSGTAAAKNKQKKLLAELAADIARKVFAFAKISKNLPLQNEVNISESDLNKLSDTVLKNVTHTIYTKAQENIADLATYQVTTANIEALLAAIDTFGKMMGKPRVGKVETSVATKELAQAIDEAEETLDELDAIIEIVRLTEVNFYNGYKAVRKLINTGGSSVAIKGLITDTTGEGLKGAKIAFTLNGNGVLAKSAGAKSIVNGKPDFTKKSAAKGGFHVANAADGTYHVLVTLPGYKTAESSISVVTGQMSVLAVMLEKE